MTNQTSAVVESGYARIQSKYNALVAAVKDGRPLGNQWQEYREVVNQVPEPYHLRWTMRWLDTARRGRPRDEVTILEHGCGGAGALLYILAKGYTGIHGIEISGDCMKWNRIISEEYGIEENRFSIYDGKAIPFENQKFDFIFSAEVLEHVTPDCFDDYYSEGSRVLKGGGIAYYQVPHRLVPFESHLKAWFVHWFPRKMAINIYRVLGYNHAFFSTHVFLRWPNEHFRQLVKHYPKWTDVTSDRLKEKVDFEYYDGPRKLRLFIAKAISAPIIGTLVAALLSKFVMIQTVAWK